jgi:hypothetical protein
VTGVAETAPARPGNVDREDVAAFGFMAFMGLCLGGVGVVLAAVAVGVERAWNGRAGGTASSVRRGWAGTVDDHAAWLKRDRDARSAWRQARRQWWRDGASPATKPARPAAVARAGSWVHRAWSRGTVGADRVAGAAGRFWRGLLLGFDAAREAQRNGAGFAEIIRVRPGGGVERAGDDAGLARPAPGPAVNGERPEPAEPTGPSAPFGSDVTRPNDLVAALERRLVAEKARRAALSPEDAAAEEAWRNRANAAQIAKERDIARRLGIPSEPAKPEPPTPQTPEEPMTITTTGGETHADLTAAGLAGVKATLANISDLNDQIAGLRDTLAAQVRAEQERGGNKGSAATAQAIDEADAVIAMLGRHIAAAADATTAAEDQTSAAEQANQEVLVVQDDLHRTGATGEFVSTATSD